MEIKIGTDAPLTPRQKLVTVPYAFKADMALTVPDGSLTANKFADNIFNPLAWLLTGNSGTNGSQFIGTTDDQPLVFKVNNKRALQMQYVQNDTYSGNNFLGGYWLNSIKEGVVGATVFGGMKVSAMDCPNRVTDYGTTVSGGGYNLAGNDNELLWDGYFASVGGGFRNTASGASATVGGGFFNIASGGAATVGGGEYNIASGDFHTTVAGGRTNIASGGGATVGGGAFNTASGYFATVTGGTNNTASGAYAIVGGGITNSATGWTSFAAGFGAKANHDGAFVWADYNNNSNFRFESTAANQFNVRASGGVRIFSNSGLTTGVTLAPNDGAWNSVSDRNAKTAFRPIDTIDILERLVAIPITTWNYKGADSRLRHIGPMAQDFSSAFGVGADDRHISTIDADGVALAAIQGLNRKLEANNAALKAENAQLRARLDALAAVVAELKAERK